jgi:hypothetical protein
MLKEEERENLREEERLSRTTLECRDKKRYARGLFGGNIPAGKSERYIESAEFGFW